MYWYRILGIYLGSFSVASAIVFTVSIEMTHLADDSLVFLFESVGMGCYALEQGMALENVIE